MTPDQVKSTMSTRWSYLSKAINNKKALDLAFQKHQWTMQQDKTNNDREDERQRKASESSKSSPQNIAMAMAQRALADGDIRPDDPNYQAEFYKAYQYFLNPTAPKPEEQAPAAMATGGLSQPTINTTGRTEVIPTKDNPNPSPITRPTGTDASSFNFDVPPSSLSSVPYTQPGTTSQAANSSKTSTANSMVTVISPNGQVGTIPRANLKEALKRGYKLKK